MTNVNQIMEATKAAQILYQVTHQVSFHPNSPDFTHPVHTDMVGGAALPASTSVDHATHAVTKTAASDTNTPASIRSGKIN